MQDQLLTLLSDNWNSANTDSITPSFVKITDYKDWDFVNQGDVVFSQPEIIVQRSAGVGTVAKLREVTVNVDVRVAGKAGSSKEDHFRNVYDEVIRILDTNMVNPFSGTQELDADEASHQDLSNKAYGLWRKVIPVRLKTWNVARGS